MRYGFIIDNRKCIGCHACTVACKAEHDTPIGVNRTWVKYIEKGSFPNTQRHFSVMRCNHCDDAPCMDICPVTALFRRSDGIVDFDPERCIGCKACIQACPYDALYIDPNTHTAAKCNYCAHRVDVGLEPACVNVCPEEAIISGDLDEPNSKISKLLAREQVTARKVEKGTKPKLFYIEGDVASLNPTQAEPSNNYMSSSQSSGVGHFAKYAEARLEQSNTEKMAKSNGKIGQWLDSGKKDLSKVLVPTASNGKSNWQKGKEVLQENTTRVYDAPGKGLMWGWEVSAYVWTKAISTGVFLVLFLIHGLGLAKIPNSLQVFAVSVSLFFLAITGGLLIKDLDRPKRFFYVLLRPQWSSWLVKGAYLILSYSLVLLFWGVAKFLGAEGMANIFIFLGWILALLVATYTAFLFAQAKGRDLWQSPMLALHMLTHALIAGSAFLLLTTFFWRALIPLSAPLTGFLFAGILFQLFTLFAELLTPHSTADAQKAIQMMTRGKYKKQFWGIVLFLGNILPLILLVISPVGGMVFLSAVLVLIGIAFWMHLWVTVPQLIPLS